jgi:hypothetical protein
MLQNFLWPNNILLKTCPDLGHQINYNLETPLRFRHAFNHN